MEIDGVLHDDAFDGLVVGPGYRDIGLRVKLNRGDGTTEKVEVRLSRDDSIALLRELLSAHQLAWGGKREKPLDPRPGEVRPWYLEHGRRY